MVFTGRCLGDHINFEIAMDELPGGVICHCKNCRVASSHSSYNIVVKDTDLKVTKGKPAIYTDPSTTSGTPVERSFCAECGTSLWSISTGHRDSVYLKAGTVDDADKIKFTFEIFKKDALPGLAFNTVPGIEGQ